MSKYDEVLRPFVAMMEKELHANAGKGDRPGWLAMSADTCLLEIFYHLGKLQKAVKKSEGDGIGEYAADVANMCMMLADICGVLAIAHPVPPAGGEPEVFEPHGWAQTDGPRINAFTREFDIAEEWAMAGYGTVELLNSEHVEAEIDRLRGEHQAHVGRLQSDVELLAAARHKLCIENENLQAELTEARELYDQENEHVVVLREALKDVLSWMDGSSSRTALKNIVDRALSNQSAPAEKGRGEPVEELISVDRSYRNGVMTGFQFGVIGDEKGYAQCISRLNTGIKDAKAEQPAPVARDGWAEKMLMLIDQCIPDKHKTPGYSIVAVVQDAFNEVQTPPVAVVMPFDFEHPLSKERRTVTLTKRDVFDGMEDYFYDKLSEQICQCESVGETNVVDCNCDEYVHDFEIVEACLEEVARLNSEPKP